MDEQSYLQRVQACERSLYRVARSILWNDDDCADAVQQAVFNGWIKMRHLRDEASFQSWLTRILVNECRNLQRRAVRQKRIRAAVESQILTEPPPARGDGLADAVRSLSDDYRLTIVLHYMEGYRVDELARMLRLPQGTVKSRLRKARLQLKTILAEEDDCNA